MFEKMKHWLRKQALEQELHAFHYFGDREGVRAVLQDMKNEGFLN